MRLFQKFQQYLRSECYERYIWKPYFLTITGTFVWMKQFFSDLCAIPHSYLLFYCALYCFFINFKYDLNKNCKSSYPIKKLEYLIFIVNRQMYLKKSYSYTYYWLTFNIFCKNTIYVHISKFYHFPNELNICLSRDV